MAALQGTSTGYEALANRDIQNPLAYFSFWIIPEIFDNSSKEPFSSKVSYDPSPQNLKNYTISNLKKDSKTKEQKLYFQSRKLTNTITDVLNARPDCKIFNSLLKQYPVLYNQLRDYKGSAFVFTDQGAQTIKLNRYDTFQLENLMRYHTSKTVLYYDQLKNKKLRVKTLLDNQFIVVHNPSRYPVGSQDQSDGLCTKIVPGKTIIDNYYNKTALSSTDRKEGNMGPLGAWESTEIKMDPGMFMVHADDSRSKIVNGKLKIEKLNKISEIIECDNGIIYIIEFPVDINYYQF